MDSSGPTADRRRFLKLTAGGASMAMGSMAMGMPKRAEATHSTFPPDVNSKFYADGRVHPFPGNTVICHLPQQGSDAACFDALMDVYRDAPRHSFVHKIGLLPTSSYHMTVFGGANDRPRLPASWPADLPLDTPMRVCNKTLTDRLKAAKLHCGLPIRMKVDPSQDPTNGKPLTMRLLPFDSSEEAKLETLRRGIADVTKIPMPEPDRYRFHISIGYFLAWLTPSEEAEFVATFNKWSRSVAERAPVINLGAPEFCIFEDMYAFKRVMFLD